MKAQDNVALVLFKMSDMYALLTRPQQRYVHEFFGHRINAGDLPVIAQVDPDPEQPQLFQRERSDGDGAVAE